MRAGEISALARLLLPYRSQVEALWDGLSLPGRGDTEDRLLTVPQAADRLACSRWHIYDLVRAGKLDRRYGGTNGRTLRLSESDVQKYIDSIAAMNRERKQFGVSVLTDEHQR